jgi:hypothetical protein
MMKKIITNGNLNKYTCLIYFICACLHIVVSNTYCVPYVALCCQFSWIVHFWLALRYSLMFIYTNQKGKMRLWKESFNSDGQQFHHINKTNDHLSPKITEHKKDHDIWCLKSKIIEDKKTMTYDVWNLKLLKIKKTMTYDVWNLKLLNIKKTMTWCLKPKITEHKKDHDIW